MVQFVNRNNQTFNDPILRVKPSPRDGEPSGGVKRFGLPIFGMTGMACCFAWLALCVIAPPLQDAGTIDMPQFTCERLSFLGAMAATALLSLAAPRGKVGTRVLKGFAVAGAVLSACGWAAGLVGASGAAACGLWALSGIACALLTCTWGIHLAAFTNQGQNIVAITGSLAFAAVLAYVAYHIAYPQSIVITCILPILSAAVYFGAAPRTEKRDELLRTTESLQLDRTRYLVKEEFLSCACMVLFGYVVGSLNFFGESSFAFLGICITVLVASIAMLQILLRVSESVAYALLGMAVPSCALFAMAALLASGVLQVVALVAMLLIATTLVIVHFSNVARNSKHLSSDYTRGVRLAEGFDTLVFAAGWALSLVFVWSDIFAENGFAIGLFIVFALFASLVSICLFTASPDARHIPGTLMGAGEQERATSLLGSLRKSALVAEFDFVPQDELSEPAVIDAPIAKTTAERFAENVDRIIEPYNLSAREKDVFVYLARGYNAQSIAQKLTLSPNTVKTHIRNIYAKFDIHSQQELVAYVEQQIM